MPRKIKRKDFLRSVALGAGALVAASCAPAIPAEVVKETVVVEKEVPQTVVVEKSVEKAVPQTVVVEKVVGGLPVPREQALVLNESAIFRVFDSCNPYAPNANFTSGWDQLIGARLMYLNWTTGESNNMLVVDDTPYEYNSDFTEFTLHTRKEVMWNDGQPFTANDIKFTVEMLMANNTLSWSATFSQWVDSVTCPDDNTAVFKLKNPNPRFHWYFKQQGSCPIVAQHEWEGQDPVTYKAFPPIGTGPYKWMQSIPEARMIVFEKVENWWGKALGYDPVPQYVVWQTSPPPEAEIQDLADNFIDHAHSYTSDAKLLEQSKNLNKDVVLAPWRDPCPRGIWFNCAKYPLSKPEVRWAMFHCIDKQKAADKLYPWPTVPAVYTWADWGGNAKFERPDVLAKYDLTFDPEKGAKILDDLGFKPGADGIRVDDQGNRMEYSIIVPQQGVTGEYPIALDFAENLAKIGIKAAVKWTDYPVFDEATQTGNFDITSHWWCGNWQEPPAGYNDWQSDKIKPIGERATAGNWVRLNDPEIDKVTKQIDVMSPDDPAIEDLYTQAIDLYFKNMPSVPVVQTTFVMPFNGHYWSGWPHDEDIKTVPFTWWPEFQYTLYNLKSTGVA